MIECNEMTKTYATKMKEFQGARRESFLKSSSIVLARKGIRRATMDDIAEEADVAKVVLYRYFGAKDKLVHAVLEEFVDEILEADAKEADWWTDRVRNTLHTARNNKSALILLLRHSAYDLEFGLHFERLRNVLTERVEERLIEVFGHKAKTSNDGGYIAPSITTFFLNAYLNWLETGDAKRDDHFFEWVTKSVQSMSYFWFKEAPPND